MSCLYIERILQSRVWKQAFVEGQLFFPLFFKLVNKCSGGKKNFVAINEGRGHLKKLSLVWGFACACA